MLMLLDECKSILLCESERDILLRDLVVGFDALLGTVRFVLDPRLEERPFSLAVRDSASMSQGRARFFSSRLASLHWVTSACAAFGDGAAGVGKEEGC